MPEAALYILCGIALYAGAHHLYLLWGGAGVRRHAVAGLMYLLLAGLALGTTLAAEANATGPLRAAATAGLGCGILLWVVLLWQLALLTRVRPLLLLDLLTAAWIILLIGNPASAGGLPYSAATPGGPSWIALGLVLPASLLFAFYAAARHFADGERRNGAALLAGLSLLALATLPGYFSDGAASHLADLVPFGFLAFLFAADIGALLKERARRPAPRQANVIYGLSFEPQQASFHTDVAELRTAPAVARDGVATADTAAPPAETAVSQAPSPPAGDAESPAPFRVVEHAGPDDETPRPASDARTAPLDTEKLHIVTDNLIDIAVYATMALNRYKRGDTDAEILQSLCRKVRTRAINTRHLLNRLIRNGDKPSH